MKTLGEFITERRKQLSLSQKELAALIKIATASHCRCPI
jgi:transcriptional regulator with XRE-family HTH domain